MGYAGDERRSGGTIYRKYAKKKSVAPPPIDFGFLGGSGLTTGGPSPGTFWASNPIPQTGAPLVPTTKPEAINAILASSPEYQAALASLNAEGVSDRASRDAAIRRAIVMFGGVPNVPSSFLGGDLGSFNSILDPTTRSLASQNTTAGLSILARLKQAAEDARRNTVNNLGARGTFRSGETGWRLKRNALDSDRANFDATMKLLDYMSGVQAAYTAAERARQQQALALSQQTITNYDPPPNPPPTPYVPPIVPPDPPLRPPPPPTKPPKKKGGGGGTKVM